MIALSDSLSSSQHTILHEAAMIVVVICERSEKTHSSVFT